MIPYIIDYLLRHGKSEIQANLKSLISKEGLNNFIEKLQIAIVFEVAGRESECGSRDNLEIYKGYLAQSGEAFSKYCASAGLIGQGKLFQSDEDVSKYAQAIQNKYPNRFSDPHEMDVVAAALDIGHTLDEFRCYWPSRMKEEIATIDKTYSKDKNCRDLWQLAKFSQQAVRITGDRLMTELSDGFHQRDIPSTFGDMHSIIFRNNALTDPNKFVLCSQNAGYCWELLKKVPKPISYSYGETTYAYVSGKFTKSKPKTARAALQIIRKGRGAIRLVNTKAEKLGFEMTMLNDPVYFRPIRQTHHDRNWILEDRLMGRVAHRSFKKRRSLQEQKNSPNEAVGGVHADHERGLPKFTEYTKKLSFTLLRTDAKIKHFTGEFPKEVGTYKPIGFLYDVNEINQKSQKYVFDKDVGTSSKFWLGKDAANRLRVKEGRKTQFTLAELQQKLADQSNKGEPPQVMPFYKMQHASNELLMCPRKSALQAIFATENIPSARILTLVQGIHLYQDYGLKVPPLIIDGKGEPQAYTLGQLRDDIMSLKSKSSQELEQLYDCFSTKSEKSKRNPEQLLKDCSSYFAI